HRSVFWETQALEGIKWQVGYGWRVDMDLATEPAVRLFNETIFIVVDTHRTQRAFAEIKDLVPGRRTLAGDHVHLVVAVEMVLVGPVADLLSFQQFVRDVRIARRGKESREPVEARNDTVADRAGRHVPRPADHRGRTETAFID